LLRQANRWRQLCKIVLLKPALLSVLKDVKGVSANKKINIPSLKLEFHLTLPRIVALLPSHKLFFQFYINYFLTFVSVRLGNVLFPYYTMSLKEKLIAEKLPRHIAIIMDGNGRWAKEKGKDRLFGHYHGEESDRNIVEGCAELK